MNPAQPEPSSTELWFGEDSKARHSTDPSMIGFAKAYADFIHACPTSWNTVHTAARSLTELGVTPVAEDEPWPSAPGTYLCIRNGSLAVWRIPEELAIRPAFRIVGAHTDSPMLKVKPQPQSVTSDGFGQLNVEIYGGAIWNSWLDRELTLAGYVLGKTEDGTLEGRTIAIPNVARIPQLAIHLDRSVNDKLHLDPQRHMKPVWNVDYQALNIMDVVARAAGLGERGNIRATELFLVANQYPEFLGVNGQFIAAPRQDNLSSVYAGLSAVANKWTGTEELTSDIPVFIANDHEEVGSGSADGAAGPFLENILKRTARALGITGDAFDQMRARSIMVSSDAGHSVHPNYSEYHDPDVHPVMGRGPMIKVNANQRYATDPSVLAVWLDACEKAGVATQKFVSNNGVPCGSTIGPITSTRLGIPTIDVGVGLLSMHSAREMASWSDIWQLSQAFNSFWHIER